MRLQRTRFGPPASHAPHRTPWSPAKLTRHTEPMASLVLGPMLRYVARGSATIWVETDEPCEVRILGEATRTFCVAGHHYALVEISGLEPDTTTPYEVHLDGTKVWPESAGPLADWPPSVIRLERSDRPFRLMFGSCRVAYPLDDDSAGTDALHALA